MTRGRTGILLLTAAVALVLVEFAGRRARPLAAAPGAVEGVVEPVTLLVRTGLGGTVAAVGVRAGEPVSKGQIVLELEAVDGDAAQSVLELRRVAGGIRGGSNGQQIDTHADVIAAEAEYVAALANLENGPPGRPASRARLDRAARNRQQARQRIARTLDAAPQTLDHLAAELNRLREQQKVRAPRDAVADLIGPRVGDHVFPGQAVALLVVPDQYEAQVVPPPGYGLERLPPGTALHGVVDGAPFRATVNSVATRRIPVALRSNGQPAEEPLLRLRWASAAPLSPGTRVVFILP